MNKLEDFFKKSAASLDIITDVVKRQILARSKIIPININIPDQLTTTNNNQNLTFPDQFTARFQMNPPLNIQSDNYCDLIVANFPYSIPNIAAAGILPGISAGNNRISINWNLGGFVDYYLDTGLYAFFDVQYALNQIAVANGWILPGETLFTLVGVQATQSINIIVTPTASMGGVFPILGIVISFANPSPVTGNDDSLGPILGFPNAVLNIPGGGANPVQFTASDVANFAAINTYILYIDIVRDSYVNGVVGSILFALPLGDYAPNSIATYKSTMRFPVHAVPGIHNSINVRFTDNFGNPIPLRLFQGAISFSFTISPARLDGSL